MSKKITYFQIFIWLAVIEGAASLFYLLNIPTDAKNVWLFGFSKSRLIIILGIFIFVAALVWLGIIFWKETNLAKHIQNKASKLANKHGFLWGTLILLVLLVVTGVLFLFQWRFTATDQQIMAYIYRLTPVVLLAIVVGIQAIILLKICFFHRAREGWLFVLIVIGGFILLQWLLVAEFFLTNKLFPDFFVVERYSEMFQGWMPYILFQTALYVQLPYLLRHKLNLDLTYGWIGFLFAVGLAIFYYNATHTHALEVNTDLRHSDQDVYVEFTRHVSESNFTYSGVRNQTPGYPYIQAIFCHADLTDPELFNCGKQVNIILSLVFLTLLFIVFRIYLPPYPSFVLLLIITVSLFIFKAGYMTVELTFYFASFISFLLMCLMFIRPSIKLGIFTGIILGLTHILKASVLPGVGLFIFLFLFKEGRKMATRSTSTGYIKTNLASLFFAICCFLAVIFPYIHQSKEIYGQYFYNVNSTFYIWYDSWEDAKQAERDHAFTDGWPDLLSEQAPGPSKYLQDHSISQISSRLFLGLGKQISHIWNQYSVFNYLILYFVLAVVFLLSSLERANKLIGKHIHLITFVTFYMLGYIFLFAWYYPIAGGPRFIAGLYIPILFSIFIFLNALASGRSFELKNYLFNLTSLLNVVNVVVVAVLISDTFIIISDILPNGYFGS